VQRFALAAIRLLSTAQSGARRCGAARRGWRSRGGRRRPVRQLAAVRQLSHATTGELTPAAAGHLAPATTVTPTRAGTLALDTAATPVVAVAHVTHAAAVIVTDRRSGRRTHGPTEQQPCSQGRTGNGQPALPPRPTRRGGGRSRGHLGRGDRSTRRRGGRRVRRSTRRSGRPVDGSHPRGRLSGVRCGCGSLAMEGPFVTMSDCLLQPSARHLWPTCADAIGALANPPRSHRKHTAHAWTPQRAPAD
jgi:hypothetical protein